MRGPGTLEYFSLFMRGPGTLEYFEQKIEGSLLTLFSLKGQSGEPVYQGSSVSKFISLQSLKIRGQRFFKNLSMEVFAKIRVD